MWEIHVFSSDTWITRLCTGYDNFFNSILHGVFAQEWSTRGITFVLWSLCSGLRREPPTPDIHNTLTQRIQQLSSAETQYTESADNDAFSQQRHLERIIEQLKEENK